MHLRRVKIGIFCLAIGMGFSFTPLPSPHPDRLSDTKTTAATTPVRDAFDRDPLHPIFISVTDINHNPQDKIFEIACKIFTDDLEAVLGKATGTKVDLFHPRDTALTGRQIHEYLTRHLVIKVDGKPVSLTFLGFEREQDAVWSYLEVRNLATTPKHVNIMNNLLYESYPQQINLMHVTVAGKRKSTKLDFPESDASFSW